MAHQQDVKSRILRAGAELFMERGFAATSVREIGERAGVGQSSLYHHVRSKGQLLRDLHGSFVQELIGLLENVTSSDATPTVQLREVIRVVMSVLDTHLAEVTIYLRESHAMPVEFREDVTSERSTVDGMVDLVIQRGVELGEFREDLDVHLTRLAILGMCNWAYHWYRPGGSLGIDEVSDYFADLVVQGLLKSP